MNDNDKQWKPEQKGNAKTAFNEAAQGKALPLVKTIQTQGRDSEMVRGSQPGLVLKPPGFAGAVMARGAHNAALAADDRAAQALNPKPPVPADVQKEIDKLNAKFKQAAIRERQQDRGR